MKETKAETILVWMTADQKDWLRLRAEAEDASMSWVLRRAIREFMLRSPCPEPPLDESSGASVTGAPLSASESGPR